MAIRAVTLTIALLLSACGREAGPGLVAEPSPQPDPIIVELQSSEEAPLGLLSYGGVDQEAELGTHCWGPTCVDYIGTLTPSSFTQVPGDASIELQGDGEAESIFVGSPPEKEVGEIENGREVRVHDRRAKLDLEPGRYVLAVFARWPGGDANFSFGIEVPARGRSC